jgi:TIR domain
MAAAGEAEPGNRPEPRWDVALSFAGEQRDYVKRVAESLRAEGINCFYDEAEEDDLWGKNLTEALPAVYGEQAAAVVVFISAEYAARDWTRLERLSALNRAVRERQEYVLPARFDDTPLPGLLSGIVTTNLRELSPTEFAAKIKRKLAALGIGGRQGSAQAPTGSPAALDPLPAEPGPNATAIANTDDQSCPQPVLATPLASDLAQLSNEQVRALCGSIAALDILSGCLADLDRTPRLSADFDEISADVISAAGRAKDALHLAVQQVGRRSWPHEEWALSFCAAERRFRQNFNMSYLSADNKLAGSTASLLRILQGQYPSLFAS